MGQTTDAQLSETLKLIPNDANAIAIINVEKLYGSDMAAREKWIQDSKVRYANSPLYFPTATKNVVLAAELDLVHGSAMWEAAFMTMKNNINMDAVAKICKGNTDTLGSFKCVDTGGGGTLLKLNSTTLATRFPSNRQQIGRWARSVERKQTGNVSEYLRAIVDRAKNKSDAEIIMGIDLTDAANPNMIRAKLGTKKWGTKVDTLVKTISSIRGVIFEVRLKSSAQGVLRIEFGEDASVLERDGKELVIAALRDKGLYIKDLDKWIFNAGSKEITFKGRLSTNGLRRVASIIEPPRVPISASEMNYKKSDNPIQQKAMATKEHWDAVQALLKDIRNYQPQTRNQLAFYYERYARKIDSLPILNVDDEELDYGAAVADILRQVATGRRSTVAQRAASDKQYRGVRGYEYSWGAHGWYGGGRSAESAATAASANIVAQGAISKAKLMQGLDDLTGRVRRSLTKKFQDYQIEF